MSQNQNPQEVTRIDLFELQGDYAGQIRVEKYPADWVNVHATRPQISINGQMSLDQMVEWMAQNGWIVRRWPGGARGWKYELKPVRSRAQVINLRGRLMERKMKGDKSLENVQVHSLDLAFEM